MPDYIKVQFDNLQPEQSAILIAELSEQGYEGFEEEEHLLKAYIAEPDFEEERLQETNFAKELPYSISRIKETNWNAQWETGFEPVLVDDFVAVRADFHKPISGFKQEIIITPKMSFGTGHHATTYLMLQQMRGIDFTGKTVIDFGTGTGILAILAEKMGASKIHALDIDDWSIENTLENLERNGCSRVICTKTATIRSADRSDIVLANINKQVILEQIAAMADLLVPGGTLLLSGLLEADEAAIRESALALPLEWVQTTVRDKWISLRFRR